MSRDEFDALGRRILSFAKADATALILNGNSVGNLRWALNRPTTAGDGTYTGVSIQSYIGNGVGGMSTSEMDDASLQAAVAEAEKLTQYTGAFTRTAPAKYVAGNGDPQLLGPQTYLKPRLWSDASFGLDAADRAELARRLVQPVEAANLRAAGYIEVGAEGGGLMNTRGLVAYYALTSAEYSVTIRTPDGTGSGWAGISDYDWARIDVDSITSRALKKCRDSAHPAALEPGRYTLIMEPQAVADMIGSILGALGRREAEKGTSPFGDGKGGTRIGQRVLDDRITLSEDPMDPEAGYLPFDGIDGFPLHPQTWIEHGVLKQLATYDRRTSGSIRMSGGETSMEEMIGTTRRGLLVTRFNGFDTFDQKSLLSSGNTRDGLWLIENGRIKQSIKNFRFNESPMFVFNNLEQLGRPVRVFSPRSAMIVPPAKVRDFNFTSLVDAV